MTPQEAIEILHELVFEDPINPTLVSFPHPGSNAARDILDAIKVLNQEPEEDCSCGDMRFAKYHISGHD